VYWIVRKLWLPVLVQLLWYGWQHIDPAPSVDVALSILAMVGLAGAAKYLQHSTLHIDQAYRLAELFVLTAGWVGVTAIVVMLVLQTPTVGLVGGAFLLYVAGDAFPTVSGRIGAALRRFVAWARREHVALRADDPRRVPYRRPTPKPRTRQESGS
jgi:hypothetical protein